MPRVVYDFVQQGADAVEEAFKRIGDERRRSKQGSGRRGVDPEVAAAKEAEKARKAQQKADEREAKAKTAAETREAKARVKVAEREAAEKKRLTERQAKEEIQRQKRLEEERVKSERKQTQEREREERKRIRAAERASEIAGRQRRRERAAIFTGIAAAGGTFLGSAASKATSSAMGLAEASLKDRIDLSDAALRVAINSREAGGKLTDPNKLREEFTRIGTEAKVKPVDVAAGVQAFITKTGDSGKAMEFAPIAATAAKAAGADLEAVSRTTADLFQKFGITTAKEMQQALASIYFGGKSGAFELSDFAVKMAPIASAGQRFGVDKGVEGVRTMSGLAQIAMEATDDRDKAATAVEATLRQLVGESGKLKAAGVNVFDSKANKTRNVNDILVETISRVGGMSAERKAKGLKDIFGDEGIRGLSPLINAFMSTAGATKGNEAAKRAAGEAAVRAKLDSAMNAPGGWDEVAKDADFANTASSAKLGAAWDDLKSKVGESLLPAFEELAEKLPQFSDDIASAGEAMAEFAKIALDLLDLLGGSSFFDFNADKKADRATAKSQAEIDHLEKVAKERDLTVGEQRRLDRAKESASATSREAEFIKKFVAANTKSELLGDPTIAAKQYWDKLQTDPEGASAYAEMMSPVSLPFIVSGENQQQLNLINQEANRIQSERQSKGLPVENSGAKVAEQGLSAFARALAEATRAANAMKVAAQPVDSIYAGG